MSHRYPGCAWHGEGRGRWLTRGPRHLQCHHWRTQCMASVTNVCHIGVSSDGVGVEGKRVGMRGVKGREGLAPHILDEEQESRSPCS